MNSDFFITLALPLLTFTVPTVAFLVLGLVEASSRPPTILRVSRLSLWLRGRNYPAYEARAVRLAVPLAAVAAVVAAYLIGTPKHLPAAALGSRWVLGGIRALALFYGFLLLLVPVMRAFRGQLPIELSFRGARYEEAAATSDALKDLNRRFDEYVVAQEHVATELTASLRTAVERIRVLESGSGVPEG